MLERQTALTQALVISILALWALSHIYKLMFPDTTVMEAMAKIDDLENKLRDMYLWRPALISDIA